MSVEYKYDPKSDTFRPYAADNSNPKKTAGTKTSQKSTQKSTSRPKSGDSDWGSWAFIAASFLFGIWPVGLYLLIKKLGDTPRTDYTSIPTEGKSKTKVVEATKKVTRTPDATSKMVNILTIVGLTLTGTFGIALLEMIGEAIGYGWYSYMWEELFTTFGFLAGGTVTLAAGLKMRKRTKRIARYLACIGDRESVKIEELMTVVGKKRKTVEHDLEFMIEKGVLGMQAYVDSGRGILFRSAAAAQKHAAEKASKENLTPKEANEGAAGALRAIRYANDRIADPVLTQKIDHLEIVAGKIFREVENHPEKQQQATKFFNYYLPTTLKLLNTYAEFEDAGIEGENLKKARERIEQTMDSLVKGFDKQLDDLYRSEVMDIDSDIRVMESMLRRDISSVEDDFGFGGTAVQRKPKDE